MNESVQPPSRTNEPSSVRWAATFSKAADLVVLREQVEERVEHDVDQAIGAGDPDLGEVAHGHVDRVTTRLGPQLCDHRRREVDAVDVDTRRREWQRDPAGADRKLERETTGCVSGEERDRRLFVAALCKIVVDLGIGRVEGHGRRVALHRGLIMQSAVRSPRTCREDPS